MGDRKRNDYTPKCEWVDPRPFSEVVNGLWTKFSEDPAGMYGLGPGQRICEVFGWEDTDGNRKRVYKFKNQLTDTSIKGKRVVIKATRINRVTVEDACHHAGIDFYELYPELGHERSGEPGAEGWCPACQEHVLVLDGVCAWCDWKVAPGHMRPSAPVLPLDMGEAAFDRALELRAAGLSYSSIGHVMGIYHGLMRKEDFWRRALRERGVEPTRDGFGPKRLAA